MSVRLERYTRELQAIPAADLAPAVAYAALHELLRQMRACIRQHDKEAAHTTADAILCRALIQLPELLTPYQREQLRELAAMHAEARWWYA